MELSRALQFCPPRLLMPKNQTVQLPPSSPSCRPLHDPGCCSSAHSLATHTIWDIRRRCVTLPEAWVVLKGMSHQNVARAKCCAGKEAAEEPR